MSARLPFALRQEGEMPLVIAHRGSSATAPENTIAAFRRAIDDGADGVELDVQRSADGVAVVYHDRTLRRTTGRVGRLASIEAATLQQLDCGSWFDDCYAAERVPSLEDALALFSGALFVNIELKGGDPSLVDAVVEAVRASGAERSVLISSFDHRLVARLRRAAPALARGVLLRPLDFGAPSRAARRVGAQAVVMARSQLRTDRVLDAREHGLAVIVYTVDRPKEIARCVRLGVDAIITNDPAATRAIVDGLA